MGAWILRVVVGFAVFFPTVCWLNYKPALLHAGREAAESRFHWRFFAAHLVSISAFGVLSFYLYGTPHSRLISDMQAVAWLGTGMAAIACGGFAVIRPYLWLRVARSTGYLWIIAVVAMVLACIVGNSSRSLWPLTALITFQMTRVLISPFIAHLMVNPATMQIGSERFYVEIADECSGLEGIGLMLAFGVTWIVLFREQCRFPQAFLLLPAGAALIFLFNSVRIAALILIGNAGADRIANGGFHSQAGWILFNLTALGFTVALSKVQWLSNAKNELPAPSSVENPTAAWLMPFVMILAAGMLSRALTDDFEWLYPLRFFAAAATLVFFRQTYGRLEWRIDWFGPAIGVVVFILWIGLDRFLSPDTQAMPSTLALTLRVAAAIITVPIAEELAFRGFLYRRLLSADFESVSLRELRELRRYSWIAILVSSVIFGSLHGSRWFAGAVAGVLYALVMLRRGRTGDAVAAHAITNALIAVDVLAFHHWQLW